MRYTPELRDRAVRMVAERRPDYSSEGAAIAAVASALGIGSAGTLRKWVRMTCSDRRCSRAKSPSKDCRCACDGTFHGSALPGPIPRSTTSEIRPASPRPSKPLRNAALTLAAAAAITVGPLAATGVFDTSATGGSEFSVQVQVDLNKAASALAAVLELRSTQDLKSKTSGLIYNSDCANNTTGEVKHFLTLNHCKQYATVTRTFAKHGTTVQVAFTWVEMPTAALARMYKTTVDMPRTGNPPGVSLAFNGFCYASGQQGATVWTVLLKPTGHVNVDREILQVAARRKLALSYLQQHCIK